MSKGFLRWMVKDAHKQACTYGCLISFIGLVAMFGRCPQPIPFLLIAGGIVINACDAIYAYIKYQKFLYNMEQDRIVRDLKQQ
jgi:hypothetical protein